ncbi:MAG: DUF1724 domain-containing protein [Methanobrevibacter sp.]|jgi:predicted transcriptional regulator|nr:DUF1724 domain-containing protein [Methanobrevibacter sp.]
MDKAKFRFNKSPLQDFEDISYLPIELNELEDIKYILSSAPRSKVLLTLTSNEPCTLETFRLLTKSPSSNILKAIKDLEKLNLVKRHSKYFCLSSKGKILGLNFLKLVENGYIIKTKSFYLEHKLNQIPYGYLKYLYLFKNSEYLSSTDKDLAKPTRTYLKSIKSRKNLNIVLPIFSPIHLDEYFKSANDGGCKIEIITTEKILDSIFNNYKEEIAKTNGNIHFFKTDIDLNVFLTSSQDLLMLSLFYWDGQYDDSNILLAKNKKACKWGLSLFNHFKKNASIVDI